MIIFNCVGRLMLQFSTRGLATSGNRFKVAGNGTANGGGKHQTSDDQVTVNFQEFEKWWKYRMGLSETSHAVIPELFEYTLAVRKPPLVKSLIKIFRIGLDCNPIRAGCQSTKR
eukprot:SAG31_NODE_897_length_11148_cov_15.102815_4_plen_114_part_00